MIHIEFSVKIKIPKTFVIYQWNIRQFVYQWSPKVGNVSPKGFKQYGDCRLAPVDGRK
ncbi:MAG: hypothetical protein LBC20_01495 [Planctomycetaceae bacterium]|nr:hypothetical protein [Planctomycetaceae bacterium]